MAARRPLSRRHHRARRRANRRGRERRAEVVWQAEVDGIPHGTAVADGRLYVSTDRGSICCFLCGRGDARPSNPRRKPRRTRRRQSTNPAVASWPIKSSVAARRAGFCLDLDCCDAQLARALARGRSYLRDRRGPKTSIACGASCPPRDVRRPDHRPSRRRRARLRPVLRRRSSPRPICESARVEGSPDSGSIDGFPRGFAAALVAPRSAACSAPARPNGCTPWFAGPWPTAASGRINTPIWAAPVVRPTNW